MRLPLAAIITLFVVSILTDFYIWTDIRQGKSRNRWVWSNIYAISSLILWIFLGVTVALPRRGHVGGKYTINCNLTYYMTEYNAKII